jgi:hypothetical protein
MRSRSLVAPLHASRALALSRNYSLGQVRVMRSAPRGFHSFAKNSPGIHRAGLYSSKTPRTARHAACRPSDAGRLNHIIAPSEDDKESKY